VDPVSNPYAPGAGMPPPELAGRDELRETVRIALARIRAGRPAKSISMVGLRGVGKTVLLERMRDDAEASGIHHPGNRSGDVAEVLGRGVTSLGPTRNQLIAKGMIWSPSHGDTAFTVPLFDAFMRRIMPGDEWKR
jgi:hypothetical protein